MFSWCIFFLSSSIAEKFGRCAIIFTSGALFIIGALMIIFAPGDSKQVMILILIGRIIEGACVGCSPFSCSLYASEIAPTHLRGMLSSFMQMTIVLGLFAPNVVNYLFDSSRVLFILLNELYIFEN